MVQPGLSGGAYKPLSERDMQRIYDTALDILENIGIADPIPEILRYALPGGCYQDERGRLRKHVTIWIDGERVRDREELGDALGPDSEVHILQALSGG